MTALTQAQVQALINANVTTNGQNKNTGAGLDVALTGMVSATFQYQPPMVTAFGAVGDGVTDNTAVFASMEASSNKQFALPAGSFLVSNILALTKPYVGPGEITDGPPNSTVCNAAAGVWSHITSLPSNTQELDHANGLPFLFQGDLTHVFPEYFYIGNIRTSPTASYYNSAVTPHTNWVQYNGTGSSGVITVLTSNASIGDTVLNVVSNAGIINGQQYGFNDGVYSNALSDMFTVVSSTSNTITITSPLTTNHAAGTSPYYPETTGYISDGKRTTSNINGNFLISTGPGDCYIDYCVLEAGYNPLAGQTTVASQALGIVAATLTSDYSGVQLNPSNIQMSDNGNDISVFGDVRQYYRTNNTGAKNAFWIGNFQSSLGTKNADAAFVVNGAWNAGLDTVGSTTTVSVNMAPGQEIIFDSAVVATDIPPLWGRTLGTSTLKYNSGTVPLTLLLLGYLQQGLHQLVQHILIML